MMFVSEAFVYAGAAMPPQKGDWVDTTICGKRINASSFRVNPPITLSGIPGTVVEVRRSCFVW